MFLEYDELSD